jgi:peptidoglycan/LPS O-acetylase OafA/YrhL
MASIPYRPEIDGLRALAVAVVVAFHLVPESLPGGYLGVDIFFVISGYLITSIILADQAAGTFSVRDFWARRIRRILPAAAFLLAAVLLAAILLDYPQRALSVVGRQAVASLTFVSNIAMKFLAGDYWAPASETLVLLHHWSLAVEEQFYLVYPLALAALLCLSKRAAFIVLALLATSSLIACTVVTLTDSPAAFFLPQYRAWELLAGCLLAFFPSSRRSSTFEWTGLVLMFSALGLAPMLGPSPGLSTVLAVAGAALYIRHAEGAAVPSRLLSSTPAVGLGKASYSLYLWHWPCIVMAKTMAELLERPWLTWFALPTMVAGTALSYLWIERVGRRLNAPYRFAGITSLSLLGISLWATFNTREPMTPEIGRPSWRAAAYDCVQNPPIPFIGEKHIGFDKPDISTNPRSPNRYRTGVLAGANGERADWFLLGDSHALMWASQLDDLAKSTGVGLRIYAGIGLSPLLENSHGAGLDRNQRAEYNVSRLTQITNERPRLIIIAMRWDNAQRAELMPKVEELVATVRKASPSSQILLLGQPPVAKMRVSGPQWVAWRHSWGAPVDTAPIDNLPSVAEGLNSLFAIAHRQGFTEVWDPSPYLLENQRVRVVDKSQILLRDDDHLSEQGAAYIFQNSDLISKIKNK